MNPIRSRVVRLLVPFLLTSAATAGNVLVVDPTDPTAFALIGDAVQAASPGDVIVVHPKPEIPSIYFTGLYPNFTVDKSLTIIAEEGAFVRSKRPTIRDLGPDDHVVIRGLQFERAMPALGANNIRIENNQGSVWIEDCVFRISIEIFQPLISAPPIESDPAVLITGPKTGQPGSVTFKDCEIYGTDGATDLSPGSVSYGMQMTAGVAIRAERAYLALWDCVVSGGEGQPGGVVWGLPGGDGKPAIDLDSGYLFASGCTITGGDGGFGIPASGGMPCVPGGDGAHAVELTGVTAEMIATTRTGGAPGAGAVPCSGGVAGTSEFPVGSVVDLAGGSFSLEASAPRREDQTLDLELDGPPGSVYLVDLGFAPKYHIAPYGSLVRGILHIDASAAVPVHPSFAGVLPVGTLSLPLTGALQGQQGDVVWLQIVGLDPAASTAWTAGAPTAFVLLAAGL